MLTLIGLTVEPGSFFLVNNTVAGCTGRLTQSFPSGMRRVRSSLRMHSPNV